MKKYCLLALCLCLSLITWGNNTTYTPYKIKAQFIGGYIYPHDKSLIDPLTKGPALGGEVAFEWASDGNKDWHKHFNNPDVGLALQVIDLGNPDVAGQMIGVYPYINLPMVKNDIVSFNVKIGGGLGFATRPCDIAAAVADPRSIKDKAGDYNFAIGGPISFAIAAGLNVDVKVHKNVALTADFTYNHFSSASLYQPNAGLNMFNGYLGVKYLVESRKSKVESQCKASAETSKLGYAEAQPDFMSEANKVESQCKASAEASLLDYAEAQPDFMSEANKVDSPHHQITESPNEIKTPNSSLLTPNSLKRWSGEVILSGGAKKLYYKDTQYFPIASLNVAGYYHTCRQHRIGIGLDLFFDGAYRQTVAPDAKGVYKWTKEYTQFGRTCTPDEKFSNKLRFGINIANELTIGKVGIFAHVGIYLYDPIKNMEPAKEALAALNGKGEPINKGIFYPYDIQNEDGWNYFRIGVKYHITPHFLVNVSFKTHLQKVEFAEFGIGYAF